MGAHSRLILLAVTLMWTTTTCASATAEASRWRWPDEPAPVANPVQPKRISSGRVIPHSLEPPRLSHPKPLSHNIKAPLPTQEPAFLQAVQTPKADPVRSKDPGPALPIPVNNPAIPAAQPPPSALPSVVEKKPDGTDQEVPTGSKTGKNESSVPLLKDAGKPGNPYELLNKIFPPEERIRTKEEEEANLNALQNVDLGGLTPREVYLADDNLVVVRGFNFKKTYDPDPAGEPIDDYQAPAPRPPPPPEPGTVFYPSNDTGKFPLFPFPDFNSTNPGDLPFFPFVPGGLDQNNGTGENPEFQLPFPFLPPPPPHWDSEKEFNEIPQQFPGNFPPQFQGGPQGGLPPQQGFPPQGGPPPQGFLPGIPPSQGSPPLNGAPAPPPASGLPPFDGGNGTLPQFPLFPFPPNATDDDDFIPFTPLFPERPVDYYYPSHVPTEVPPGPYGPGIFVPPPKEFFAPRNKSEKINVTIPEELFKPPFNLPNYYEVKDDRARPAAAVLPVKNTHQYLPVSQEAGLQNLNHQPVPQTTGRPQEIYFGIPPSLPPNVHLVHNQQSPVIIPHPLQEYVQRQPVLPVIQSQPLIAAQYVNHGKPGTNHYNQVPHSAPAYYNHGYQVYPNKQYTSLESDIAVNYRHPRPEINPDSELIDVSRPIANQGKATHGALQSYRDYAPVLSSPNHRTGLHQLHGQGRPIAEQPQIRPSHPIPASPLQKTDNPGVFVTVYRYGGGSYAYNLNGKR